MQSETGIVYLHRIHVKETASVLGKAFQDDPLFTYFLADAETRRAKSSYIWEPVLRYSLLHGELHATSPSLEAVSVWLPHDKVEMSFWKAIRNGGLRTGPILGLGSVSRQTTATNRMCAIHRELAPYPHFYLYAIGVDPALQGRGYAGLLMTSMLSRLDSEHLPCYLDNTNEKNRGFYEHYGFRVIREYQLPKSSVRLWAMVRDPVG